MISIYQLEKGIPGMTGLTVLIISSCSFLLSFFNLQAAALQAGINPWLSWLWPVCIDALLIAGSLMVLRSSLRNEPAYVGWSVLLSFTLLSTIFNVLHSPEGLIAQAAHAVPPVALCVSIELLMMCIRSDLNKSSEQAISTPEQITGQNEDLKTSEPQISDQASEKVKETNSIKESEQVNAYYVKHPGSKVSEVSRVLGMSRYKVEKYRPSQETG